MSSLDCDIPFGECFAEKSFGDISLCCNEKSVKNLAILIHPRQPYRDTVWTAWWEILSVVFLEIMQTYTAYMNKLSVIAQR